MSTRRTSLYLVVQTPNETSDEVVSIAVLDPVAGAWFYAEVVDFTKASCSASVQAEVLPKLRRIPGTKFCSLQSLPGEVLSWLIDTTSDASDDESLPGLNVLSQDTRTAGALIEGVAREARDRGIGIDLTVRPCQVDQGVLSDFYKHSGGARKVRHNGLVDAFGIAISDPHRIAKVNLNEIRHFEMLMGTKAALSCRAWVRRVQADQAERAAGAPVI